MSVHDITEDVNRLGRAGEMEIIAGTSFEDQSKLIAYGYPVIPIRGKGPTWTGWPEGVGKDRAKLAELPLPVITAGLRRAALCAAPDIADTLGQDSLSQAAEAIAADDRSPKRFHWPGNLVVSVTSKRVELG